MYLSHICNAIVPMGFSIWLHAINLGWSIVYIEGSKVILSKNVVFISLNINFALANSADSDDISLGSSRFASKG